MKKILILGASRYYIRGLKTAKQLGYHTVVVDRNPHSPGFRFADEYAVIDINDHVSVLAYARKIGIEGIVPINDFGVFTAAYVSEKMGLHYLNTEIARIVTNKALLRNKWEREKQPNPKYRIVKNIHECRTTCHEITFPVIFKPAVSMGGSRGVIFVDSFDKVQEAYAFSSSFYQDKTILVEEFLSGVAHSAEVLIYQGKAYLLAVSDDIKLPLPACVNKNLIYPTQSQDEERLVLKKVLLNAVESLGVENGYAHVESCTLPSGEVKLFELSLRPGGGGIPDPIVTYLTGVNAFEQYLRLCVGEKPKHLAPIYEKGCNYHFITPPPGKIKSLKGFDEIVAWEGILDATLLVKPGDVVKQVKVGSNRAGFIIAGGIDREHALTLGYQAEKHIRFEY